MLALLLRGFGVAKLTTIGLLVWSFINPSLAWYFYYFFVFVYTMYSFITLKIKPKNIKIELELLERDIFLKYHLYFLYPNVSVIRSSALAGIQMTSIIFGILFALKLSWFHIISLPFIFLFCAYLTHYFNPLFYHKYSLSKKYDPLRKLELDYIERINKLINEWQIKNRAIFTYDIIKK